MKHENAEMIKTKVDQMDLVLFRFRDSDGLWAVSNLNSLVIDEGCNFFLCLPQHKEACLHWLNGGEVRILVDGKPVSTGEWQRVWSEFSYWNSDEHEIRIKPKKEKRWIATLNGWNASQKVFASKQEAVDLLGTSSYQFHEIEVEV